MSAIRLARKQLQTGKAVKVPDAYLQTWWVIEKCVKSWESDRTFCDVVGVLKQEPENLPRLYRATKVTVLTSGKNARKGVEFGSDRMRGLILSKIDFEHKVFPEYGD